MRAVMLASETRTDGSTRHWRWNDIAFCDAVEAIQNLALKYRGEVVRLSELSSEVVLETDEGGCLRFAIEALKSPSFKSFSGVVTSKASRTH